MAQEDKRESDCRMPPQILPLDLNASHRQALAQIRARRTASRSELAQAIGVSAPAMTKIARDLIDMGLAVEAGRTDNPRGAPSTKLTVAPDGAYSIGVFVEIEALSFAIVNLAGKTVWQERMTADNADPQETIARIGAYVARTVVNRVPSPDRVVGAGIAASGAFVEDRRTFATPRGMESWRSVDVATLFEDALERPVILENDATAAALGEILIAGEGAPQSYFYIYFGNGLGAGSILNGQAMRGGFGNAGEIGMLAPPPMARPTLKSLSERFARPLGETSAEEIDDMFANRQPEFMAWLDEGVGNLEAPLRAVIALLDPGAILLGGRLPRRVLEHIAARLQASANCRGDHGLPTPDISLARVNGADAALYGAASLPLLEMTG